MSYGWPLLTVKLHTVVLGGDALLKDVLEFICYLRGEDRNAASQVLLDDRPRFMAGVC